MVLLGFSRFFQMNYKQKVRRNLKRDTSYITHFYNFSEHNNSRKIPHWRKFVCAGIHFQNFIIYFMKKYHFYSKIASGAASLGFLFSNCVYINSMYFRNSRQMFLFIESYVEFLSIPVNIEQKPENGLTLWEIKYF